MMCNPFRKRKVEKMIEEYYRNGFYDCLGGWLKLSPEYYAPDWENEVIKIAYIAGYEYGEKVLHHYDKRRDKKDKRYMGFITVTDRISARVYADCYAAARLC